MSETLSSVVQSKRKHSLQLMWHEQICLNVNEYSQKKNYVDISKFHIQSFYQISYSWQDRV